MSSINKNVLKFQLEACVHCFCNLRFACNGFELASYVKWFSNSNTANMKNNLLYHFLSIKYTSYLQIRDGPDAHASLLLAHSGMLLPVVVNSSGNVAHITFSTDSSTVNKGFLLKWTDGTGM